jgi:hypothetical protein
MSQRIDTVLSTFSTNTENYRYLFDLYNTNMIVNNDTNNTNFIWNYDHEPIYYYNIYLAIFLIYMIQI